MDELYVWPRSPTIANFVGFISSSDCDDDDDNDDDDKVVVLVHDDDDDDDDDDDTGLGGVWNVNSGVHQ